MLRRNQQYGPRPFAHRPLGKACTPEASKGCQDSLQHKWLRVAVPSASLSPPFSLRLPPRLQAVTEVTVQRKLKASFSLLAPPPLPCLTVRLNLAASSSPLPSPFPPAQPVTEVMVPLLKFWFHEEVRRAAANIVPELLHSVVAASSKQAAGVNDAAVAQLMGVILERGAGDVVPPFLVCDHKPGVDQSSRVARVLIQGVTDGGVRFGRAVKAVGFGRAGRAERLS
eukprot:364351-Chlamydomonas_euryale.AAC.1